MNKFIDQILASLKAKNPVYIRVKVLSQMPQTEIIDQMEDSTYKIKVAAMPAKGEANEILCKFLKKTLKLKDVVIVSGGRDKVKLIRLIL